MDHIEARTRTASITSIETNPTSPSDTQSPAQLSSRHELDVLPSIFEIVQWYENDVAAREQRPEPADSAQHNHEPIPELELSPFIFDDVFDEDTLDEETPDGETPDGETLDRETPDGETPDGETLDGETVAEYMRDDDSMGDFLDIQLSAAYQRSVRLRSQRRPWRHVRTRELVIFTPLPWNEAGLDEVDLVAPIDDTLTEMYPLLREDATEHFRTYLLRRNPDLPHRLRFLNPEQQYCWQNTFILEDWLSRLWSFLKQRMLANQRMMASLTGTDSLSTEWEPHIYPEMDDELEDCVNEIRFGAELENKISRLRDMLMEIHEEEAARQGRAPYEF